MNTEDWCLRVIVGTIAFIAVSLMLAHVITIFMSFTCR